MGLFPCGIADQDIWKPLRGKEGGAAAIAFDVHFEDREAVDGGERTRQSRKKLIDASDNQKTPPRKKLANLRAPDNYSVATGRRFTV